MLMMLSPSPSLMRRLCEARTNAVTCIDCHLTVDPRAAALLLSGVLGDSADAVLTRFVVEIRSSWSAENSRTPPGHAVAPLALRTTADAGRRRGSRRR